MTKKKGKKELGESLLYELGKEEINQIVSDHKCFNEIEFTFFIDANDILSYIDPYNLIYPDDERFFKNNLADSFYAINSLLNYKSKSVYLLKEYAEEFNLHKKKFNEISSISIDFQNLLRELDSKETSKSVHENDERLKKLISERFSEIYFIVSRRDKAFYELYKAAFSDGKIQDQHPLEKYYFEEDSIFKDEDHSNKIKQIYDLFPSTGYSSLVDSIAIYKVFLLNQLSRHDIRYIYFSSAQKSRIVLDGLMKNLHLGEWKWLREILEDSPGEKLCFFRNKNYSFGYVIHKILFKKTNNAQKVFEEYCTLKGSNSVITELLNKTRENIENLSIFSDCKLNDYEIHHSVKSNQNIERLFNKIISLRESIGKTKKIDIVEEEIFASGLVQHLYNFSKENELIINRGKDNIISLMNTIPPLFVLNDYLNWNSGGHKAYKSKVETLILHACVNTSETLRISREAALKLFDGDTGNNTEINNLLIIFLLILIKYESIEKKDSDTIAYELSEKFENQLKGKLRLYELAANDNRKQIKRLEYILRELYILKMWAIRRKGEPFSKIALLKSKGMHEDLGNTYPDDYRFQFSYFLTRASWLYQIKNLNKSEDDLNEINQYVEETIRIGTKAINLIFPIKNITDDFYLSYANRTIFNSLSFMNCVRLDLLLLQNRNLKKHSKKSRELLQTILKYKHLRKKKKANFEDTYESLVNYQPVFAYVESYIEYLEACMKSTGVSEKLGFAKESIEGAINLLKKDKGHRPFFLNCCQLLSETITKKRENTDIKYESFIMKL